VKRLKGPDLKLPEPRVPDFLADLYYDLRDRRLLPLVALAIVAIIAVPILLGRGSGETEPTEAGGSEPPAGAGASSASSLTVVRAAPGLRDYRRRLRDRSPVDPFHQRYAAPDLAGTDLGSAADGSATATSTSTTTSSTTVTGTTTSSDETSVTATGEGGGGNSGGGGGSPPSIAVYSFGIDLEIIRTATKPDGSKDRGKPQLRRKVLPPAALPSEKAHVFTYVDVNPKTGKPLLLVSDKATAVYGEAKCLSGAGTCQLLEVEPGVPTTFVYGANAVRFKVTVLRVAPVATGHL
jgi:hypothetical protein